MKRRLWFSDPPFLFGYSVTPRRPIGGCRRVHLTFSQFPWPSPAKKSVAPPPGQSGYEGTIYQYNYDRTTAAKRCSRRLQTCPLKRCPPSRLNCCPGIWTIGKIWPIFHSVKPLVSLIPLVAPCKPLLAKIKKHFNQSTMSLLFYVILFYIIFLVFASLRSVQSGPPLDVLHPCICPYQSS